MMVYHYSSSRKEGGPLLKKDYENLLYRNVSMAVVVLLVLFFPLSQQADTSYYQEQFNVYDSFLKTQICS